MSEGELNTNEAISRLETGRHLSSNWESKVADPFQFSFKIKDRLL